VLGGREHDGTALLYEIAGDARLLYATDTAALPHDELMGPYDLVLLELTFGDRVEHGTAHLDLPSFGHEVARLRAGECLAPAARVVAVHLSHHNPVDLPARLAYIGAEVVPDGSRLTVGARPDGPGRRLLVTGGARCGKSRRAEALLAARPRVTYLATAPSYPDDPEWVSRVAAHRQRRPDGWRLVETSAVADVLRDARPDESVLVDCLALWLTALIDGVGAWDDPPRASAAVDQALAELLGALADTRADVILVTNEVGSGIVPATASGRLFRDLLGTVNSAIAAACDDAEVVTAGIPQTLKGRTWTTST
jgi:adenosylcobinamide kinase/adenosylcobinamide-phosphate guanylyltransferase